VGDVFIHVGDATEGSAKLLGRMPPNPGLSLKELGKLGNELYALMLMSDGGATAVHIAQQPTLMRLRIAYDEARSRTTARPPDSAIAQALRGLIEAATYPLSSTQGGNNDEGKAARIYLALEPDSTALLLKDRRKQAEPYIPDTLRSAAKRHGPNDTSYEKRLMEGVGSQLIEREFDHLDQLARSQLLLADNWAPQPHAMIYRTYRSAFTLLASLYTITGRKVVYGMVERTLLAERDQVPLFTDTEHGAIFHENMVKYRDKLVDENYYLRFMSLIFLGRLFLTAEFVSPAGEPDGNARSSSAREILNDICALLPLDPNQICYLTSVYVDGQARCGYKPYLSATSSLFEMMNEMGEDLAIARWIYREYTQDQWEPLEQIIYNTWTPWVLCDCWKLMEHSDDCAVGRVISLFDRYQRSLEDAWGRLQEAMNSPTIGGFAGWHDGQRLYHDLGLQPNSI
jgi:hypothetical protein